MFTYFQVRFAYEKKAIPLCKVHKGVLAKKYCATCERAVLSYFNCSPYPYFYCYLASFLFLRHWGFLFFAGLFYFTFFLKINFLNKL